MICTLLRWASIATRQLGTGAASKSRSIIGRGPPRADRGFESVTGDEHAIRGDLGDPKADEQHQNWFAGDDPRQYISVVDVGAVCRSW